MALIDSTQICSATYVDVDVRGCRRMFSSLITPQDYTPMHGEATESSCGFSFGSKPGAVNRNAGFQCTDTQQSSGLSREIQELSHLSLGKKQKNNNTPQHCVTGYINDALQSINTVIHPLKCSNTGYRLISFNMIVYSPLI